MRDLAAIAHVKIIRIHTRIPVADPARVTPELVAALRVPDATTWVALHANHPRELTPAARAACTAIIDAGIPLVSQSVLLRGVNDDIATLTALDARFRRMPDQAVLSASRRSRARHISPANHDPRGAGADSGGCAGVFPACASRITWLDIPGGFGKAPIGPQYLKEDADSQDYRVVDYCGGRASLSAFVVGTGSGTIQVPVRFEGPEE